MQSSFHIRKRIANASFVLVPIVSDGKIWETMQSSFMAKGAFLPCVFRHTNSRIIDAIC